MPLSQQEIYRAYNFRLDIQGTIAGYFTEVSSLNVNIESIAYREGGGPPGVRKLPGRVDVGDITLKYGLTESTYLWDWLMTGVNGNVERRNVSIILLTPNGEDIATRWDAYDCWIRAWSGSKLEGMAQQAAIEEIKLVAESLERASG